MGGGCPNIIALDCIWRGKRYGTEFYKNDHISKTPHSISTILSVFYRRQIVLNVGCYSIFITYIGTYYINGGNRKNGIFIIKESSNLNNHQTLNIKKTAKHA